MTYAHWHNRLVEASQISRAFPAVVAAKASDCDANPWRSPALVRSWEQQVSLSSSNSTATFHDGPRLSPLFSTNPVVFSEIAAGLKKVDSTNILFTAPILMPSY
jgi:hypothetical protein